jgi:phenylalanine-4-hydroxylase
MKVSRYSPVVEAPDGHVLVELAADHPGVTDPHYRLRRNELAALALGWRRGEPVPLASYLPEEHEVWHVVSRELDELHERYAVNAFLAGKQALALADDEVPQLDEVSRRLAPLTGFSYLPVAGLAPLRDFYGSFRDGVFWSTQYLRHPSVPLYTPEPDLIHEVVGHGNQLANPLFAELYKLMGAAVTRAADEATLRLFSQVFWFTMEFGVVREAGELKAVGAGILSSVGEIREFREADVRPADIAEMGRVDYDITRFQPVLYAFDSMAALEDELSLLFTRFEGDEASARAAAGPATRPSS